jgi:uncharacterized membrane protein (Fun14 family)
MPDTVEHIPSADEPMAEKTPSQTRSRAALPRWQKLLLGAALLLGVAGLVLHGMASERDAGQPRATADASGSGAASAPLTSPATRSFLPVPTTDSKAPQSQEEDRELPFGQRLEDWSPLLMKLGFSFVVGFCIGYALVVFMKVTAFVAGAIVLVLFGLQYVGIIEVNWHGLAEYYNAFLVWLQPRADGFREFVGSNLPSVGMAAMGLLVGVKRK